MVQEMADHWGSSKGSMMGQSSAVQIQWGLSKVRQWVNSTASWLAQQKASDLALATWTVTWKVRRLAEMMEHCLGVDLALKSALL